MSINMVNTRPDDKLFFPEQYETESKSMYYCRTFLKKHVPITTWLPRYSFYNLQCDFIAGLTVGLMVLPQALAYASIAGLPHSYGLYSSFMGCFVYCFFGTSKDITIGPTAILSLMVQSYNIPNCGNLAVVLAFYSGCILLLMGIFRLGFLVRFVSVPVISAFTSAAAITIACSQLKDFNGINTPNNFFANLITIFKNITLWNFYDIGMGIACLIVLFLMGLLTKLKVREEYSMTKKIIWKCLWLCSIARNAIVVIVSCCVIYVLETENIAHAFTLISPISHGLPPFKAPDFSPFCQSTNKTLSESDVFQQFNVGLAVVPLLAFIEAMAIGKAFSRKNNYKIDPTQELIALGLVNIAGSFVSSFPVTGSFSRTAVNSQSNVKTPLAGFFTGLVVLLALEYLTHLFTLLPKACLGAVIVSAVIPMCDAKILKSLWQIKRIDLLPFMVTFLACFYSLDVGLILGILMSIFIVLYDVMNPTIEETLKDVSVLRLHNGLMYPAMDKVVNLVEDLIHKPNPPIVVILDMSGVSNIDYTAIVVMQQLLEEIRNNNPSVELLVTNVCNSVKKVFIMAGLHGIITSPDNLDEENRSLLYS